MTHFDPDDLVSLALLEVVCRGEIVPGGAGDDRDLRAQFALRSRDPKVLDPAHRAAFTQIRTAWMVPAAYLEADVLAAPPQGVRR